MINFHFKITFITKKLALCSPLFYLYSSKPNYWKHFYIFDWKNSLYFEGSGVELLHITTWIRVIRFQILYTAIIFFSNTIYLEVIKRFVFYVSILIPFLPHFLLLVVQLFLLLNDFLYDIILVKVFSLQPMWNESFIQTLILKF